MAATAPALLLIAYGSCSAQGLSAYRRFEARVRASHPGLPVRWAYTSMPIRSRLAKQVRLKSDSVIKALKRLIFEHYGPIVAQPLQIVPATENAEVRELAGKVTEETGIPIEIGLPLLSSSKDMRECVRAVALHIPPERRPDEDVVLMGHGTRDRTAQQQYDELSGHLADADPRIHLATMSGTVSLDHVLPQLVSRRVWLVPFLSAVGRHTVTDMAGQQPTSWKSRIESQGHQCVPVIAGAVENEAFAAIWLRHLNEAMAAAGLL